MFSIIELDPEKFDEYHVETHLRPLKTAVNKSHIDGKISATNKQSLFDALQGAKLYTHHLKHDYLKRLTRQAKCFERVKYSYEGIVTDLELYSEDQDVFEYGNDDLSPFYEYGSEFSYRPLDEDSEDEDATDYYEFLISGGGPSEMFRFYENGAIEFRLHDWFDGANIWVTSRPIANWLREQFDNSMDFESERNNGKNYPEFGDYYTLQQVIIYRNAEHSCSLCGFPGCDCNDI